MKSECLVRVSTCSDAMKTLKRFYGVHVLTLRADLTASVTARSLCLTLCRHLFLRAEDNMGSDKDRFQSCKASVSRSKDDMLQNVGTACIYPQHSGSGRGVAAADVKRSWLLLPLRTQRRCNRAVTPRPCFSQAFSICLHRSHSLIAVFIPCCFKPLP